MYQYWTDLGIVNLNIISHKKLDSGIMNFQAEMPVCSSKEVVKIFLYDIAQYEVFVCPATTYREKMMQKGFYIGHHFGEPVKIKIVSNREIHFCAKDYNRILWSYITKVILTIHCMDKGYLHIKAGVIEIKHKAVLLVGRGGAGKTEMLKRLCNGKNRYIANTHAIINQNKILGINTNIRVRENGGDKYLTSQELFGGDTNPYWIPIDKVMWVQYRTDEHTIIEKMSTEILYENMKQFSEAIANWELHEDVYDYYKSDVNIIGNKLHKMNRDLYEMLKKVDKYYINLDIHNDRSYQKLCEIL